MLVDCTHTHINLPPLTHTQLEGLSDDGSPSSFSTSDIPSPKSYLVKLQASLNESKRYTQSSARARHQSSPLQPTVLLSNSSESEDDTLQTLSDESHRYNRGKLSQATKKILRRTNADGNRTRQSVIHGADGTEVADTTQRNIFHSLGMINSQLSQLLHRLPDTPPTPHPPHTQSDRFLANGTSNLR